MAYLALLLQDWDAAHAAGEARLHLLGRISALLLLAFVLFLVVRALVRGRRYSAVRVLGAAERDALQREIAAAERRTVGEIAVVVLERSDRHPVAAWIAGTATLVAGTGLFFDYLPWSDAPLLLAAQAALFLAGFALARLLPDFARLFVSERAATAAAAEQAVQEFHAAHLHRTEARTGVLLFVSLFEHRAIVLGDDGIDAAVDAPHWEATCDAILAGIRRGDLAGGLAAGLRLSAEVLAQRFPWAAGDRDEVHDHVIVRRE
jgi:putative membrane protein